MHSLAVAEVVKSVRKRIEQGDHPTEPPLPREMLEHALESLAPRERADGRGR